MSRNLLPQGTGEELVVAAMGDPSVFRAVGEALAVFYELCDLQGYLRWLDARGFARPPIHLRIHLDALATAERKKLGRATKVTKALKNVLAQGRPSTG